MRHGTYALTGVTSVYTLWESVQTSSTLGATTFQVDPLEVLDFGFGIKVWRSKAGWIRKVDYGDGAA